MNKRLKAFTIIICCFLFTCNCNNKLVSFQEDNREVGYECHHMNYQPDTTYLNNYIRKFSKFLPNEFVMGSIGELELFYGFHCYECPEEDKYGMFFTFTSLNNIKFIKINIQGEIICNSSIIGDSNLHSDVEKTIGEFIKRDCEIEDGDESVLVVKKQGQNEFLSFYKSIGINGSIEDASHKHLDQVRLVNKILAISNKCLD